MAQPHSRSKRQSHSLWSQLAMASGLLLLATSFASAQERSSGSSAADYEESAGRTFLRKINAKRSSSVKTHSGSSAVTDSSPTKGRRSNFTVIVDRKKKPSSEKRRPPLDSAVPLKKLAAEAKTGRSLPTPIPAPAVRQESTPKVRHAVATQTQSPKVQTAGLTAPAPTIMPYPPEAAVLNPEPDPMFSPRLFRLRHTATADVSWDQPAPKKLPASKVATHLKPRLKTPPPAKVDTRNWAATGTQRPTQLSVVKSGNRTRLRRVPTNEELRKWQLPVLVPVSHKTVVYPVQEKKSSSEESESQADDLQNMFEVEEADKPGKRKRTPIELDSELDLPKFNPADTTTPKNSEPSKETKSSVEDGKNAVEPGNVPGVKADEPSSDELPEPKSSDTKKDADNFESEPTDSDDMESSEESDDEDLGLFGDEDDDSDEDDSESSKEDADEPAASESKNISRLFGPVQNIDVARAVHVPVDSDSKFTEPKNAAAELPGSRTPSLSRAAVPRIYSGKTEFQHHPLYFNENDLEMCGKTAGCLTTARSTARFLGNVIALPVRCCAVSPWQHVNGDFRCTNEIQPVINAVAEDPRESIVPVDHPRLEIGVQTGPTWLD